MKIGVLGSGDVGRALGRGFVRHGHEVMIGSRTPAKLDDWVEEVGERGSAARARGPRAPCGQGADRCDQSARSVDGLPELFVGHTDSLGERVQRLVPDARVVKAFNTVNNALMADPNLPGGPPTMFTCGNDSDAKATVSRILEDFGYEPADIGPIERSRALEEMCIAWTYYGIARGRWDHAFKMLHR